MKNTESEKEKLLLLALDAIERGVHIAQRTILSRPVDDPTPDNLVAFTEWLSGAVI